jgi:serine/threonine protein kinase
MTNSFDFAFVFDATDSMTPMIQAAHDRIVSIATALRKEYADGYSFRFGAVGYRDPIDDQSVSVRCPFTSDPEIVRSWLGTVAAEGGGDFFEDWVDGMRELFQLGWRSQAFRCVFWIADAPTHGTAAALGMTAPPVVDRHPDQIPFLLPYVEKLAKMKMVFIGLDLSTASLTFPIMERIYLMSGGPSFKVQKFRPEFGRETQGIAAQLVSQAMSLVDRTIKTTGAGVVEPGVETTTCAPTPDVTEGFTIPVPPELKARLPGYRDFVYLDRGVQSAVYKAVCGNGAVAVKHSLLSNEKVRKYFDRERIAIRTFAHPACLSCVDVQDWGEEGVLLTPFQPNKTLETMLRLEFTGSTIEIWQTKKTIVVLGIAFGMEHIHSKGFVHRDLKPANVFLNQDCEPVIGDFGVATDFRPSEAGAGPTMYIGTPLHMAPEMWVDESEGYNQEVDVYAYAVLVYSMFTQEPEAMLDDGKGRATKVSDLMPRTAAGARFRRVDKMSDAYWDLVTSCWKKEPIQRPTFTDILDSLIENLPLFMFPKGDEASVRAYVAKMVPLRPRHALSR